MFRVRRSPFLVAVDGEPDVVGVAHTRGGDVKLAVAKARQGQEDADARERLSLRLVDGHRERHAHRKLAARPLEREGVLLGVELDARDTLSY